MPVLDASGMLEMVAEVTAEHGVRGLIGAGWTNYGAVEATLPKHLFVASTFDHDVVLPRCRAAVHHGGAGTTAVVLRAGLPSVVASVAGDQAFWGWRLAKAGVGVTFPFRKLSRARLEKALRQIRGPEPRDRARELGARLRAEDGVHRAADDDQKRT